MHVDVVFKSPHLGEEKASHQSERYTQHDGQWNEETLVERTEDEVDEDDADAEDDNRIASASGFFTRDASEFVAVAHGQCLFGYLFNGCNGFACAVAVGRKSVHLDGAVEVEAAERFGAIYLGQCDELADGGHFARGGTDEHVVQRILVQTIGFVGLHHDAVELGKTVEVGRIVPADEAGQCAEYIGGRHACPLAAGGVYFDGILRELRVERSIGHLDFGPLVQGGNEVRGVFLQRVDVTSGTVLHVKLKTAAHTVTHDGRLGEDEELGGLDVGRAAVYLVDDGVDVVFASSTFLPRLQLDDEHTARRSLSAHHAVTAHVGVTVYLRDVLDALFHFGHGFDGLRKTTARRGRDVHEDTAHVFVGHQSGLGGLHQDYQQGDAGNQCRSYYPFAPEEPFHSTFIA